MTVLAGDSSYQDFLDSRRVYLDALINKWEWLLGTGTKRHPMEPIPEKLWEPMAILFENQSIASSKGMMSEQTMTTDVTLPVKYALPIVRKVYPQLILSKIASIQPMPMASGGVSQIFYQDFLREDVTPNTSLTVMDSDYAFKGENEVPNRVKMEITAESVTATKDILGAVWSTEVEEDARGALNLDVPAELINNCAEEILRELEYRALNEILTGAGAGNVNWSYTVGTGHTNREWYETLHHAFIDAESLIYAQRYRNADWIIGGRTLVSYAMKAATFQPAERMNPPGPSSLSGVQYVGRVVGFWDVYLTPYITATKGIMGTYPRSVIDTGYVFAPYIPLAPMPLVYAEFKGPSDATMPGAYVNTDKWSRNVRTRNAKKMVVPEMYATITVGA
jgi:hypothetical protein